MNKKVAKKREQRPETTGNTEKFSLNLEFKKTKREPTFLGFKLRNVNQLWDWRTLEDVNFK